MATDRRSLVTVLLAAAACAAPCSAQAASPTGWDAYRRLDQLPLLRSGEQARLESSYDRRGANQDNRYACRRMQAGRCVIAEHTGPGEVDSIWTTRPRAGDVSRTGTIRVELDGRRVLDDPLTRVVGGRLGAPFAFPAVANRTQASGAVWIKVPMAFRERMVITTSTNPGYVRVNYRTFDSATGVTTFDPADPATDALAVLRGAGTRDPSPGAPPVEDASGRARMDVGGPGTLTHLRVTLPGRPSLNTLAFTRVRMTFDGRTTVNAPLGELFGSGIPARVRSLFAAQDGGLLNLWWHMPFASSARVEVLTREGRPADALVEGVVSRDPALATALVRGEAGYFRATSRRGRTVRNLPWRVMEANGRGLLVGISATLQGPRSEKHLEGDEVIVADGRALRGTGTEDLFEGGFYWYFGTRSLPLVGSPGHLVRRLGCPTDCRSMYRWLVPDAVPFSQSLRFTLEHGDRNRETGLYSTTALWYGT